MSQNATILNHLRDRGPITTLEAMREYGITRLAARIYDLRGDGHMIADRTIKVENRHGETVRVSQYRLDG